MTIDFYYDYLCPFCYVASKRIQKLSSEMALDVDWKGIEIHPEHGSEGKKRKPTARTEHLQQTLYEIAGQDGIKVDLPGFVTNSRLCLEASEYAKSKGRFMQFHDEVYNYYLFKKENIGRLDVVLSIGQQVGLNTKELAEKLRSGAMKDTVESNKRSAEKNMVIGVPTIYFNGFRVHGAQSTETYEKIIKRHIIKNAEKSGHEG